MNALSSSRLRGWAPALSVQLGQHRADLRPASCSPPRKLGQHVLPVEAPVEKAGHDLRRAAAVFHPPADALFVVSLVLISLGSGAASRRCLPSSAPARAAASGSGASSGGRARAPLRPQEPVLGRLLRMHRGSSRRRVLLRVSRPPGGAPAPPLRFLFGSRLPMRAQLNGNAAFHLLLQPGDPRPQLGHALPEGVVAEGDQAQLRRRLLGLALSRITPCAFCSVSIAQMISSVVMRARALRRASLS